MSTEEDSFGQVVKLERTETLEKRIVYLQKMRTVMRTSAMTDVTSELTASSRTLNEYLEMPVKQDNTARLADCRTMGIDAGGPRATQTERKAPDLLDSLPYPHIEKLLDQRPWDSA